MWDSHVNIRDMVEGPVICSRLGFIQHMEETDIGLDSGVSKIGRYLNQNTKTMDVPSAF